MEYHSSAQHTNGGETSQWKGATLILPAITVGNVGQLAVDLITATTNAVRTGYLLDDTLLPCVGVSSSTPGDLAMGLEVYAVPGNKLFLLQQRAPAAAGLQADFAEHLAAWIQQAGFAKVWVLGGLDATFRRDAQISGQQLRHWSPTTPSSTPLAQACISASIPALENDWFEDKPPESRLLPPWSILNGLEKHNISCTTLLCFVIEGDNRREGAMVAEATKAVVEEVKEAVGETTVWRPPAMWEFVFDRASATLL